MEHSEHYDRPQDQFKVSYVCEHRMNMNSGSHVMIAEAHKLNHHMVVKHKDLSGRTEIRDEVGQKVNVAKNFSQLPKTHWLPQPNNFGEPVHHNVLRKAGPRGIHKGGNRYA